MRKEIQAPMALYPTPVTVCGTLADGRVNWLTIARVGIVEHGTFLISVNERHARSCRGISGSGTVSVNLVDRPMLEAVDCCGIVSGAEADKSDVFPCHALPDVPGAPVIDTAPVAMACQAVDVCRYAPFQNCMRKPVHTLVQEEFLNDLGKVDCEKVGPVPFAFQNAQHLEPGKVLDRAWNYGGNFRRQASLQANRDAPSGCPAGYGGTAI